VSVVGVHNTEYIVDDPSICAPDSPFATITSNSDVKLLKTSVRKVDADGRNISNDSHPRRSSLLHPRNGRLQVTSPPYSALLILCQVSRIVGPDAYYMGIVDFQQQYNFEKKV
jgi:hypothetical protein